MNLQKVSSIRRLEILTRQLTSNNCAGKFYEDVVRTRQAVPVLDTHMSYLDTGSNGNDVVLFLHGNPTSAFLWRNIIPHVKPHARCIAPDLVGFGRSGKIPNYDYRFINMYKYFCTWVDQVIPDQKIIIVHHDWGSCFGFHWAYEHQHRVKAIVHMESMVGVLRNYDSFPPEMREMYDTLRSEAGEKASLDGNMMIKLTEQYFGDKMTPEEMKEFTCAFENPGKDRMPPLTLTRDIPTRTDGPWEMVHLVANYNKWLTQSKNIPKLFVQGDPGAYSKFLKIATRKWPNQKTVVVKGHHFLQEESPDDIGRAIVDFIREINT